jgi:hypothetical protein
MLWMLFRGRDWETEKDRGNKGTMNVIKYRQILDENLLQNANNLRLE